MNIQIVEKRVDDKAIQVHSIFHTIQGEGPFTGHPAIFIRLSGCNLQCPVCDTDYTSTRTSYSPNEIVLQSIHHPNTTLVVITGGEPFRQNIEPLVALLLLKGFTVQVETNGTLPPPGFNFAALCSTDLNEKNKCFIVCSPKTGSVNPKLFPLICAYKYVMAHDSVAADGLPLLALDHPASPMVKRPHEGFNGPVYLQPCDDKDNVINAANQDACVVSCLNNGYILQLQIHKLIGVE